MIIRRMVGAVFGAALFATALASAALAQTVVIYSPQGGDERGPFIAARAREEAGLDVKFLSGGGGDLHDRLVAERNNPQADVVLGLIQPLMFSLKAQGLFEHHVPGWAASLGPSFKDADGQFHMFWQTPIALAYNSRAMAADKAPKSWLDLDKPEYRNSFVIGPIGSQTTRILLAGLIWRFVDPATGDVSPPAWDFLSAFYRNARPLPEGADRWKMIGDGTTPIVLSWFGDIAGNSEKAGIPITFVNTTGGTPIVAESVALMKGSRNKDAAKAFIEWFGSAKFMSAYAARFNQTPALPEAIAASPERIRTNAALFTPQPIDWQVAGRKLNGWLEKIQLDILP